MKKFWHKISWFIVAALLAVGVCLAGPTHTSTTQASTIITNARYYLDESTASFWSDAELLVFLNDGQENIASRALCTETTETVSLVANTVEYTPTTDYISIIAVIYNNASGAKAALEQKTVRHVGETYQSTTPGYYYDFGGKVGIFPALSSVTSETVDLYLVQRPTTLTSADYIGIPAVYEKALTYYIVAQALVKDRQFAKASFMLQLYQSEIDRFRQDWSPKREADGA